MSIKDLDFLRGKWKGKGIAQYPTIQSVEYLEELFFQMNDEFPVLHYEQKTWIQNNNGLFEKPIFWESGFIIEKENSVFELCNVQKSGRMEILKGSLISTSKNHFEILFKSTNIFNDERMIKSGRKFTFSEKEISYELYMSTNNNAGFDQHLEALLKKQT